MKTEFLRFAVVGILSTIINYGIFYLFVTLSVNYLMASGTGYVSGVFVGFYLNRRWSFKSDVSAGVSFIKYVGVYAFSLVVSIGVLNVLVEQLGLTKYLANVICIGITTILNYLGAKFFAFDKPRTFRSSEKHEY